MTTPVIMDEKVNMSEEAVRTLVRSETPMRREATTKILSGTRNRDDNCKISKHSVLEKRRKTCYRGTVFIRDESSTKRSLHGII